MGEREWKPGDVALVDHPGYRDAPKLAIVRPRREANGTLEFAYFLGGFDMCDSERLDARPVVVIDPEDREQVERLTTLVYEQVGDDLRDLAVGDLPDGYSANGIQAALREFANPRPSKPDEPTGLGAVVTTDEDGDYIRVSVERDKPWQNVQSGSLWHWDAVAAVRVLSEGVRS